MNEKIIDVHWLIYCSTLVMLMQAGFAMLECGSVRNKNTRNILFKNILDACVGALLWWSIGHGLAYDNGNWFIGTLYKSAFTNSYSLTSDGGIQWVNWFFQYVFAATSATIVSGAVAERSTITAYLVYTSVLTSFIYPVVVHWVWSEDGWLSSSNTNAMFKVIDFAGSAVVHMTGGIAGLCGSYIIGPRIQRFDPGTENSFDGHSSVLQVLGTFILWFGWYGFNAGSTLGLSGASSSSDAARSTVTTTLSATSGGLITTFYSRKMTNQWLPSKLCNGILSGLVSITASCTVVEPWASVIIGALGGFFYCIASRVIIKLKIDDPLDAFAVHGLCGLWGVIAGGFFSHPLLSYNGSCGVFYGCHETFVSALLLSISQILWVGTTSILLFGILKKLELLRISANEEITGMDISKHGGSS